MKRTWEATMPTWDHKGTWAVSFYADGPTEALKKFHKKFPFHQLLKLECFPKSREV